MLVGPSSSVHAQVPGNIRRAEHFVQFLRRFLDYLRQRMGAQAVEQESPTAFLANLQEAVSIDGECCRHLKPPMLGLASM